MNSPLYLFIKSISLLDDDWRLLRGLEFLPSKRSRINFATGEPVGEGEFLYHK